jgi:hypothetical protein
VSGIREDLPNAVHIHRTVIVKVVANMNIGGVRNARGNLRVGVLSWRGDEVRNIEVDSGIRRINPLHDLDTKVRVLRNAFVVLNPKRNALLAGIVACGLHRFNRPNRQHP